MTSTLRRRPAQRRSVERVERMLDECALLLDEVGYDALTTKEVARRAEVPIGTFYQFFHDKQGLVRALARRNLEAFLQRVVQRIQETGPGHWTDLVDLAIDVFVDMKRTTPGFGVVDFGEVLLTPGGPAVGGQQAGARRDPGERRRGGRAPARPDARPPPRPPRARGSTGPCSSPSRPPTRCSSWPSEPTRPATPA
ncbi:TetR/AcrR family transcriptional regulator [Nonomuraea salmonea]|uniref:TetR/AcrR family transcriptional regulator n=1 Tax=Nonomuraea salmonea TaxID=46181 RepID=UPI002FEDA000